MSSNKNNRLMTGKLLAWSAIWIIGSGAVYACSSDDSLSSDLGTGGQSSTSTSTSGGGSGAGTGDGGMGAGFNPEPEPEPCEDHPGEILCIDDAAITCGAGGEAVNTQDCGDEVCVPGVGCVLCIDGMYSCDGNSVLACNPGPPLQWDTIGHCDPLSLERCNRISGTCEPLTVIGDVTPTGFYYQYARFQSGNTDFLGGYDVDSLGDYLYVNRQGDFLDVYKVELLDSDGDGEFEPNQHPDNPDATGPIEDRVITHIETFTTTMGQASRAEVYAVPEGVFFVNYQAAKADIFKFTFNGQATTTAVTTTTQLHLAHLGYDMVNGTWYGANEGGRRVYSFHAPSQEWVAEFAYPDLAGSHMDGIEVVTDPNDGTPYVYVSDMTSDYLGQYLRERGDTWVQVNLFEYAGTGEYVEGMGFGALNHFWAAAGSAVYEIGGGDLAKFTEPDDPPPR